jgi:RHS repeat-associated protein
VEIRQASGREPELVRQRELLEGVCGVEFLAPAGLFTGRGIVICGGGAKYLPSVYVLVRLLRHLRCGLPVEVWHLGKDEMPEEVRGMLETVSSLGTGATTLNQVRLAYNSYSQFSEDAQAHSGAVNSGTPKVRYAYADGSDNTVRPTGITYPDGTTTITTAYGGTAANALSRPDALKEGGTTLCSYRYLGSGAVIGAKYNAAGNVEQTFRDGGSGDGGDPYTGLDRFGRLIETLWKKGTADKVRSQYGRNRFGGVVWRRDGEAHAHGVDTEDNSYGYDELYQVKERQRGSLTGTAPDYTGITNLQQEEDWTYDATGNWAAYSDTSPTNAQTRTHNAANEITQITASTGNVNPAYDPAGDMTTLPKQPGLSTAQYALKWDAWNRLVQVKDGSATVASYTYDGLACRLTKANSTETRHYYYNSQWRAVEERVESASTPVDCQYTWGLQDRWDLVRRKRSETASLDETLYLLRDYLDPVAIADASGTVLERYAYDAFGNARILAPDYTSRPASAFAWNFLFHAEFRDADTGLYNYGYRYYAPGLARWLSRDPIGESEGANLYAFAKNSPVTRVDIVGLDAAGVDAQGYWGSLEALALTEGRTCTRPDGTKLVPKRPGKDGAQEYCGLICCKNGKNRRTDPHPGPERRLEQMGGQWFYRGEATCDPHKNGMTGVAVSCAQGETEVGSYHSHPSGALDPKKFSPEDLKYQLETKNPFYVAFRDGATACVLRASGTTEANQKVDPFPPATPPK